MFNELITANRHLTSRNETGFTNYNSLSPDFKSNIKYDGKENFEPNAEVKKFSKFLQTKSGCMKMSENHKCNKTHHSKVSHQILNNYLYFSK